MNISDIDTEFHVDKGLGYTLSEEFSFANFPYVDGS
jgi:hypothetical protein